MYKILHVNDGEPEPPCFELVRVSYNPDGTIARARPVVFRGVSPEQVQDDIRVALAQLTGGPIYPCDIVGPKGWHDAL